MERYVLEYLSTEYIGYPITHCTLKNSPLVVLNEIGFDILVFINNDGVIVGIMLIYALTGQTYDIGYLNGKCIQLVSKKFEKEK